MTSNKEIAHYLNQLLEVEKYRDYCPNGLQVEGCADVKKIITGVTACQKLLDAAVKAKAQMVLVHHGYFWANEDPCIVGIKKQRLMTLLKNNINLLAYHLPLDMHVKYGNNVQLAKLLEIKSISHEDDLGIFTGVLKAPLSERAFAQRIQKKLNRTPLHIPGSARQIKTIAWCTGGAQDYINRLADLNVDAYLTGEVSERTVHIARELGIHFYAAGHHATERYGIQALGQHLAKKFNLQCEFIDIDNPV